MPISPQVGERFSLAGKVALLTGAAGLYGQSILEALAGAGAEVFIASRNLTELRKVAVAQGERGRKVSALRFDQSSLRSIEKLGAALSAVKIDILVNNAAARPMKSYDDPAEAFSESMKTNATGLFALTRTVAGLMRDGGSIINMGSIQGLVGPDASLYAGLPLNGFLPDYFFHKGGMLNFTRFLAAQYGPRGIRCNVLSPGGVVRKGAPQKFVRRYSSRTFLGRPALLEDIQGAVIFLASDASRYVTGANLPVDGGYTAK